MTISQSFRRREEQQLSYELIRGHGGQHINCAPHQINGWFSLWNVWEWIAVEISVIRNEKWAALSPSYILRFTASVAEHFLDEINDSNIIKIQKYLNRRAIF